MSKKDEVKHRARYTLEFKLEAVRLVKAGQAEYQTDLDHCRRELDALTAIKEIESARNTGRWVEVATKSHALDQQAQQYRLDTVDRYQGELTALRLRAALELNTARIIGEAHSAGLSRADVQSWVDAAWTRRRGWKRAGGL